MRKAVLALTDSIVWWLRIVDHSTSAVVQQDSLTRLAACADDAEMAVKVTLKLISCFC